MKTVAEIEKIIRKHATFLSVKFHVKSLGVFGSQARGEAGAESDIDILVEFSDTIDLFDFVALERFLSEQLGLKVDLVMKSTLKPRLKHRILEEVITIYEAA